MSVKWFRGAAEKRRKKRIREKPRPPHVPKPSVKKMFKGPKRPGVWPQELTVKRPLIHGCACGHGKTAAAISTDHSGSTISDLVMRAEYNGYPRENVSITWHRTTRPSGCSWTVQGLDIPVCEYYETQTASNPWSIREFFDNMHAFAMGNGALSYGISAASHPNCTCRLKLTFRHGKNPEKFYVFSVSTAPGFSVDKSESKVDSWDGSPDFPKVDETAEETARVEQEIAKKSPEASVLVGARTNVFNSLEIERYQKDLEKHLESGEPVDFVLDFFEDAGKRDAEYVINAYRVSRGMGMEIPQEILINKPLFIIQTILYEKGVPFTERDVRIVPPAVEEETAPAPEAPPAPEAAPESGTEEAA